MEIGILLRANSRNIWGWLGKKMDVNPMKRVEEITFSRNALWVS